MAAPTAHWSGNDGTCQVNRFSRRQVILFPVLSLLPASAAAPVSFVIQVGGGSVDVQVVDGAVESAETIAEWVDRAARAVSTFYGRFPVDRVLLLLQASQSGSAVARGTTFRGAPPFVNVTIRANARREEFTHDWILTHEFIHLAFPSLPRPHLWLEEGLSTYVEPLARTQAGQMDVGAYWKGLVNSLPQGQPGAGDRGLDGSRSRPRTYWGGALFCFATDLELRKLLGPAHGLQEALRQFVQGQATIDTAWPVERALKFADERLGTRVLQELYQEWATAPVRLDLDRIWKELGIQMGEEGLQFDDSATAAATRRAITSPTSLV